MAGNDTSVLVVDDEERLADLFATWLKSDYDVATAYDGEQALAAYDEHTDIVLLDRRMPGLSGDEVLDELRSRDDDVQVVMVTAVDPDFDIIEMGFDDYLVKPVSKDDLVGVVEKMRDRADYESKIQEYFSLASKKALLESEKPTSELQDNEEYAELVERFEELREDVDDAVMGMTTHEDFASAFQGLTPDDPPEPGEFDAEDAPDPGDRP